MNKNLTIGIVVVLVLVVGGAFLMKSSPSTRNAPSTTQTQTETTVPTEIIVEKEATDSALPSEVKEITVSGSPFKFDPKTITLKKGQKVKILFKNTKGTHDFVIDEFDVRTPVIQSGEEATVEFVANKVGIFEYYCSVGNHRAMGMKGALTVE